MEYLIVSRLTGPSLISSIYGGVCTSQNGGDKGQHMATKCFNPRSQENKLIDSIGFLSP